MNKKLLIFTLFSLLISVSCVSAWYPILQTHRKPLNITNPEGSDHVYEPHYVNVTGTNLDGTRCYEELRITECSPENSISCSSENIIQFELISNTTSSCHVRFLSSVSANSWRYYYFYYDDSTGTNPNYTLHLMANETFENYANDNEMKANWGDDPTDNGNVGWWLNTASPISGSKSLKYNVNASNIDSIHYNFTSPITDSSVNGTVSFLIRTPATDNTDAIGIGLSKTNDRDTYATIIDFGTPSAGDIGYNNQTGWYDSGINFNTNTVYFVKIYNISIDYPSFIDSKWSFSVNGTIGVEDTADTNANSLVNMSTIQFWSWGSGEDIYIDNFQAWSHDFNTYDIPSISIFGSEEQSFSPQVKLVSPAFNETVNTTQPTFYFNVTDSDNDVVSCNLYVNVSDILIPTYTNLTNYSYGLTDGGYYSNCYNGKCYFFGGKNETGVGMSAYRVFNTSDQILYEMGNMPSRHVGAGVVQAPYCSGYEDIFFIFVNTGWSQCTGGICSSMMYNASDDSFTFVANITNVNQAERGVWGNFAFDPCKIYYIAGGGYAGVNSGNISIYNIQNDTWVTTSETYPNIPSGGYEAGGYAIFNDSITGGDGHEFLLVAGGNWDDDTYDDVYWYYPHNSTWVTKASMPQYPNFGARGFSFGKMGNKFYAWQGMWYDKNGGCTGGFMQYTLIYDPVTDTWNTTSYHNVDNSGALTCQDDNEFYILGGWDYYCTLGDYRRYFQKVEFLTGFKDVGSNSTSYTNQTSSITINEMLSFNENYKWYIYCSDDINRTNTSSIDYFSTTSCVPFWNNTINISSCFNSTNYRYDVVWIDENSCNPSNTTYNVTTYPTLTYSYNTTNSTCLNYSTINNTYIYPDVLGCGYYQYISNQTVCQVATCGDSLCQASYKCVAGVDTCALDFNETQDNCCFDCGCPSGRSCVLNTCYLPTGGILADLGTGIKNFLNSITNPLIIIIIIFGVSSTFIYVIISVISGVVTKSLKSETK